MAEREIDFLPLQAAPSTEPLSMLLKKHFRVKCNEMRNTECNKQLALLEFLISQEEQDTLLLLKDGTLALGYIHRGFRHAPRNETFAPQREIFSDVLLLAIGKALSSGAAAVQFVFSSHGWLGYSG